MTGEGRETPRNTLTPDRGNKRTEILRHTKRERARDDRTKTNRERARER